MASTFNDHSHTWATCFRSMKLAVLQEMEPEPSEEIVPEIRRRAVDVSGSSFRVCDVERMDPLFIVVTYSYAPLFYVTFGYYTKHKFLTNSKITSTSVSRTKSKSQ